MSVCCCRFVKKESDAKQQEETMEEFEPLCMYVVEWCVDIIKFQSTSRATKNKSLDSNEKSKNEPASAARGL
jgi:hypothetical protein